MSKVILLADDSVTIQKVIELTFMDGDYKVEAASNGDEALERLPQLDPVLVIADVHMPGANGYEVCKKTKEHDPSIPVLLLVGMFEPFDEAEATAAGADSFLKKPFDSQELLDLVERLQKADGVADSGEESVPEPDEEEPVWGNFEPEEAEVAAEAATEEAPPAAEPVPATPWSSGGASKPFGDLHLDPPAEPASVATDEPFGTMITQIPESLQQAAAAVVSGGSAEAEGSNEPELVAEAEPEELHPAPAAVPPVEAVAAAEESEAPAPSGSLSDDDVDRIARRVVELMGDAPVKAVAWEVIPDLAEVVIKQRIRELEDQAEA